MPQVANRTITASGMIVSAVLVIGMLSVASSVFAPVAFALFIMALVWPVQKKLEASLPRAVAVLAAFLLVVLAVLGLGFLIAWSFGQVARYLMGDAARLQQFYELVRHWLEERGIVVSMIWSETFGVSSMLRTIQTISIRLNSAFSFWLVALVYVLLGLLEVGDLASRIRKLRDPLTSQMLIEGARETARKIRSYMLIRTIMSVVTGILIWLFALIVGLPLAEEWGFIGFALNYIPFIGPFVATLAPTMLALTQFDTWGAVIAVFVGLNLIQMIGGSYIEPRVSGSALSISPVVVLFSVFLWGYLWGFFGAFIGVPIMIAVLTFCGQHPSSRWVATIFGAGDGDQPGPAPAT